MDVLTMIRSILAHFICDEVPCANCKSVLCSESCPNDMVDYDDKVAFSKVLAEKLKVGPCDLGEMEDIKIEDLLAILEDAEQQFTIQKELEQNAIAEDPDVPFG